MKIERLPSGSYRIRYVDPWGRRVPITRKTAADVRAAYRRIQGDMARGEYVDPRRGRTSLAKWADDWLTGARNLSTGGRATYRRDLDRHILPALGKVPLGKLSDGDIDRYLESITQQPAGTGLAPGRRAAAGLTESDKSLAPSTVHRHYRTLHRMLEVARQRGLIARNPAEFVQPPVVPKVERPVLDPLQVDALADAITPRYRAWVYVACYGALRWSESVGLRRMDVQHPRLSTCQEAGPDGGVEGTAYPARIGTDQSSTLTIAGQLVHRGRGVWERVEPKAGSKRSVTLPDFAAAELATHLEVFSLPGPDGLVFPTRNGTPVQSPSFTANVFKRALRKADLPDVRIHDLRHTAVSLAIAAGMDPKTSQARAGHASSALHMDTYGHAYPAVDAAAAVKLSELRADALRGRLRAV